MKNNKNSPDSQHEEKRIVLEKKKRITDTPPATKTTVPMRSKLQQKDGPEIFPEERGPRPPASYEANVEEDKKMKPTMTKSKQARPQVEKGPEIVPHDSGPVAFIPQNVKTAAGKKQQLKGQKEMQQQKQEHAKKKLHGKVEGRDLSLAPSMAVPPGPSDLLRDLQLQSKGDDDAPTTYPHSDVDGANNATLPGAVSVGGTSSLAASESTYTSTTAASTNATTAASTHETERESVMVEATLVDDIPVEPLDNNTKNDSIYEAQIMPRQKRKRAAIIFCIGVLILVGVAVGVTLAITHAPTPSPTFAPSTSWSPSYSPSNVPSFHPSFAPTTTVAPSTVPTFHAGFPAFSSIQNMDAVSSVALNGNGNIVALGSLDFVTVYERDTLDNELWLSLGGPIFLQGEIASGEFNNQVLDIASNGTVTVLALAMETQVDVYRFDSIEWVQEASLFQNLYNMSASDAIALDLSTDGSSLAIAVTPWATLIGFTTVYEYSASGGWEMVGESIPGYNDGYEKGLSLSSNGDVIAIGNPTEIGTGEARVYARSTVQTSNGFNTTWTQMGRGIVGSDYEDMFGIALSLSEFGDMLAVGGPGYVGSSRPGEVRVYEYSYSTETWLQLGSVLQDPTGDCQSGYGNSVVLSSDGSTLLVGAYRSEWSPDVVCRLYEYNGNFWEKKGEDLSESGLTANYKVPVAFSTNAPYVLAIVSSGNATSLYHD